MPSSQKQTTLAGFFGKPKPGAAPPSRPTSALSQAALPTARPLGPSSSQNGVPSISSPASSTTLKTPSSAIDSSPHPRKERKRAGSPLKQSITIEDEDGSLSPPPVESVPADTKGSAPATSSPREDMEVDDEEAEGSSRRTKRKKVSYIESGSDSDSEDDVPLIRAKAKAPGRKPRKSQRAESEDDFIFDDDDDAAMRKSKIRQAFRRF
jgi:DNA mismatch repair protein MSH6